jgi:predicted transcriptional regulator
MNPLSGDQTSLYKQDLVASSVDVRVEIYNSVTKNPGIRYRELLREVGISNGVLTYHLEMLEKSGQIQVLRHSNNRVTRYFVADISKQDSNIISCLRSRVTRNIMIFVLQNKFCTFNDIVDHVGKAPSTISWHIRRLKQAGILKVIYGSDLLLYYSVTDKALVEKVLSKYKETFIERVVDNYTEMVDKL